MTHTLCVYHSYCSPPADALRSTKSLSSGDKSAAHNVIHTVNDTQTHRKGWLRVFFFLGQRHLWSSGLGWRTHYQLLCSGLTSITVHQIPFSSRMLKTALPCMMFCHFCMESRVKTGISHEKTDVLVWELQGADIWYLKFAAKGRQCPILTWIHFSSRGCWDPCHCVFSCVKICTNSFRLGDFLLPTERLLPPHDGGFFFCWFVSHI